MIENPYIDIDVQSLLLEINKIDNIEYSNLRNIINELDNPDNWNSEAKRTLVDAINTLDSKRIKKLKDDTNLIKNKLNIINEYKEMYDEYTLMYGLMEQAKVSGNENDYIKFNNTVKQMETELNLLETQINRDLI
ncbi:MAG: hypothetical protein IJ574_01780 [Bacilli bacterium]|nr:hypothetical protein [Bacilli bacterium]